ncbi:ribosomal protein S6 kinase alpha-5 [Capsaspora owczarzaki ATCC 30864]|uniref:non-specific serine/threonine protein kinase n=1 Tax=Capsaspora owczarzaki (strain ATCC 30864) TaxID=595528 RepID=A0A0D2VMP6_CAPO3|nr:ribosomal protein S6 kinase alpha-5 [Capsaspora owczarzaki ATCC 30864]KJE91462.1 AGC/RSK/MSK protein kinase, variant [Capsaspora owczarzaki ATCC 30864]|eukprot:XP_004349342.1 ribosomal protein S6 kinase alpha-5 [Capsaspora owczarzaki ATCC 30864]
MEGPVDPRLNAVFDRRDAANAVASVNFSNHPTERVDCKDFAILKMLGTGAFARVFLVRKSTGHNAGRLFAMKVLKKDSIERESKTVEHTRAERSILAAVHDAPFLVHLQYAFQTSAKLYLVLEYYDGGELFSHLVAEGSFSEHRTRFYAAEVVLAIEYLHNLGIAYRDMKLENILLDSEGHIVLTDFGLSKEFLSSGDESDRAHSFCGTVEYMAPEIVQDPKEGHGLAVDWWSLGVLIFELLTGRPPFNHSDDSLNSQQQIMERIVREPVSIPPTFSAEASSLISRLLIKDPARRLGSGPTRANEVKSASFFTKHFSWSEVLNRKLVPPIIPDKAHADDAAANFDEYFTTQPAIDTPAIGSSMSSGTANLFHGFSYVAPLHVREALAANRSAGFGLGTARSIEIVEQATSMVQDDEEGTTYVAESPAPALSFEVAQLGEAVLQPQEAQSSPKQQPMDDDGVASVSEMGGPELAYLSPPRSNDPVKHGADVVLSADELQRSDLPFGSMLSQNSASSLSSSLLTPSDNDGLRILPTVGRRDTSSPRVLNATGSAVAEQDESEPMETSPFDKLTPKTVRDIMGPPTISATPFSMQKDVRRARTASEMLADSSNEAGKPEAGVIPAEFLQHYSLADPPERVGAGATGSVFRCVQRATGTPFAVKTVRKSRHDPAIEVEALRRCLGQPNIVQFVERFDSSTHAFIVLELMQGGELLDRIKQRTCLSELTVCNIVRKLVVAINYMHSQRIVHRDLKPENLLFVSNDEDSEVKIVDFGYAKITDNQRFMTTPVFTLQYAAPEILNVHDRGLRLAKAQAPGISAQPWSQRAQSEDGYDESCDFWSLGVIAYTMLCGYAPFQEKLVDVSAYRIIQRIKQGVFDFPEKEWGSVSEPAKEFIRGLLTVDPRRRLQPAEVVRHPWLHRADGLPSSLLPASAAAMELASRDAVPPRVIQQHFGMQATGGGSASAIQSSPPPPQARVETESFSHGTDPKPPASEGSAVSSAMQVDSENSSAGSVPTTTAAAAAANASETSGSGQPIFVPPRSVRSAQHPSLAAVSSSTSLALAVSLMSPGILRDEDRNSKATVNAAMSAFFKMHPRMLLNTVADSPLAKRRKHRHSTLSDVSTASSDELSQEGSSPAAAVAAESQLPDSHVRRQQSQQRIHALHQQYAIQQQQQQQHEQPQ